jgi:hypothetical protein
MRFLFLDFDGVLNTGGEGIVTTSTGGFPVLRPELVAHLNTLVAATGCRVVYSTTWRVGPLWRTRCWEALKRAGASFNIPEDATHDLATRVHEGTDSLLIAPSRANEIKAWLEENCDVFSHPSELRFVVLDDTPGAWPVKDWGEHGLFVQTEATVGLTKDGAEWAIAWLLEATL